MERVLQRNAEVDSLKNESGIWDKFCELYNESDKNTGFLFDIASNQCIYMSPSIKRITGLSETTYQMKGISFFKSVIHPLDFPQVMSEITTSLISTKRCKNTQALYTRKVLDFSIKCANGQWVTITATMFIIKKIGSQQPGFVLGFFQPSSSRKGGVDCMDQTLSYREIEVLKHIANGDSAKIIGNKLNISINTVITHRKHLIDKLHVKNSAELVKKAILEKVI